jgi:hypothetical protein
VSDEWLRERVDAVWIGELLRPDAEPGELQRRERVRRRYSDAGLRLARHLQRHGRHLYGLFVRV